MDHCEVPRCRAEADLSYIGRRICSEHWDRLTADDASPDALRMALGMPAAPDAAMEDLMEPTTSKTSSSTETPVEAASVKKTRAPKKPAPAKTPKVKREKLPAEDVCVFAFRLSTSERTRIHEAAGGGKASQFVLAAALAAADGDVEGFKKVIGTRTSK